MSILSFKRRYVIIASMAIISAVFSISSMATAQSLDNWKKQSTALVDKHMTYPDMAIKYNKTGVAYIRVTIDRRGQILKSDLIEKTGYGTLNSASLRTIERVKQFPAIPVAHREDRMTFGVRLIYDIAYSVDDYQKKKRKSKVTSERIASLSSEPTSSEIVILAGGN